MRQRHIRQPPVGPSCPSGPESESFSEAQKTVHQRGHFIEVLLHEWWLPCLLTTCSSTYFFLTKPSFLMVPAVRLSGKSSTALNSPSTLSG